jgi:hypothetical protein
MAAGDGNDEACATGTTEDGASTGRDDASPPVTTGGSGVEEAWEAACTVNSASGIGGSTSGCRTTGSPRQSFHSSATNGGTVGREENSMSKTAMETKQPRGAEESDRLMAAND